MDDKREIFGWAMYDWATSSFTTTVAGALLAPYITTLAQEQAGNNGNVFDLGFLGIVTAKSFFPLCISISVFLQVFVLPLLGAIVDYSHLKRLLMKAFCCVGAVATCLLFFVTAKNFALGGLLFVVANLCFGMSMVLYNAFLPEISTPERRDWVSSCGFALGSVGGGILLALNFLLLLSAPAIGITPEMAIRISLGSAGLWWGGFALALTFPRLRVRDCPRSLEHHESYLSAGFTHMTEGFRRLARMPFTLRYLIAYLFYNDGIQTVIAMGAVFLSQELFTDAQRAAGDDQTFVLKIFLLVQFIGFLGALLFERLAAWLGTRTALLISLLGWIAIVVFAYGFLHSKADAWGMGASIALVVGGSQALSRSLFSRMIPPGAEASFFSIYEVSERGTSWLGPLLFSIVVARTGSYRDAILSLIVLFLIGAVMLAFTDTKRAEYEADLI